MHIEDRLRQIIDQATEKAIASGKTVCVEVHGKRDHMSASRTEDEHYKIKVTVGNRRGWFA